ncbi:MAG: PAS domain S-box protein [Chloroflexaceae bacterium]|nr:PAS domain S-box protein [Chloroflexaceae bacterium]
MRTNETNFTRLQTENETLRQHIGVLEQRIAQLQPFVDNTDDLLFQIDASGRLLYANASARRLLGIVPNNGGDVSVFAHLSLEEAEHIQQTLTHTVVQHQQHATLEVQMGDTHGEMQTMLWQMTLCYAVEGQLDHLNCICRDMTQQKQHDAERRMFQALIEHSTDFIGFASLEGRPIFLNRAGRRLMEMTDEEDISNRPVIDHLVPADQTFAQETILPTVMQKGCWQGEVRFRTFQSGTEIPVLWNIFLLPAYETGGAPVVATVTRDLTEQKRQEAALHKAQRSLDQAVDTVLWGTMDGRITYANEAASKDLGYSRDELLTMTITDLDFNKTTEQLGAILEMIREQQVVRFETVHLRKDGSTFPVEVTVYYLTFDGEEFLHAFVRDITARKQAEAEQAALQQQIIDAQREALRELSTPMIPISDEVVIMPLIGTIDSSRAQQVMETLLEGVAQHRATLAILDITGVSMVDTQVAQVFIQAAQAVKLLGAQVMITGIQPQIAQTLVQLGIDLNGMLTRSSLQSGIAAALRQPQVGKEHHAAMR